MAYSIEVERVGAAGTPKGPSVLHEAETEMEAIAIAAYEVDVGVSVPQRIATVRDTSGLLVLAYAGRARSMDR